MPSVSPAHLAFGRAVRELREARGWSQEEFAHQCGMDRSYTGGIERGERNPSLTNILKMTEALEVPTTDLFGRFEQLRAPRSR